MIETHPRGGRTRLRDVAAAVGLSSAQVSRALAGFGDVAPATRERVLRAAQELGYRPSARARALRQGSAAMRRCAVVLLGTTSEAFGRSAQGGPILSGILTQAPAERLEVHLEAVPLPPHGSSAERERAVAEALRRLVAEDRGDGFIILTPASTTRDALLPFDEAQVPYVVVNRHFETRPVNCVTIDYAFAVRAAVEHLVRLGHRRLAALLPARDSSTVRDRETGWREGVARSGLVAQEAPIVRYIDGDPGSARRVVEALLSTGLPGSGKIPTGVVCHTDTLAHAVLQAASAAGVRVPEQLSVIGIEDVIAEYLTPPLCTFDCHLHQMGVATAALLGWALEERGAAPRREMIRPELVCRASCGPAPAP
jgi:DNA-binding LacI/PurR family transcriptional regulator